MPADLPTTITGDGPAVLLVPGWGGFKEGWGPLPAALAAAGMRAVAVDLPGGGGAAVVPRRFGFRPADLAEALLPVARRYAPACVVGHSMGCLTAMALAERDPAAAPALVLLGPAPLAVTRGPRRWATLPAVGALVVTGVLTFARRPGRVLRAFTEAAGPDAALGGDPEVVALARDAAERFRRAPARHLARSARAALLTDWRSMAERVTVPATVVCGRDDIVADPGLATELAERLPAGAAEILDGVGHFPYLRGPDLTARLVARHLRGTA